MKLVKPLYISKLEEPNAQVRKDLRPYLIKWDIELLDYEKNIAKLKPSPINKNRSMSSAKEESK